MVINNSCFWYCVLFKFKNTLVTFSLCNFNFNNIYNFISASNVTRNNASLSHSLFKCFHKLDFEMFTILF